MLQLHCAKKARTGSDAPVATSTVLSPDLCEVTRNGETTCALSAAQTCTVTLDKAAEPPMTSVLLQMRDELTTAAPAALHTPPRTRAQSNASNTVPPAPAAPIAARRRAQRFVESPSSVEAMFTSNILSFAFNNQGSPVARIQHRSMRSAMEHVPLTPRAN